MASKQWLQRVGEYCCTINTAEEITFHLEGGDLLESDCSSDTDIPNVGSKELKY